MLTVTHRHIGRMSGSTTIKTMATPARDSKRVTGWETPPRRGCHGVREVRTRTVGDRLDHIVEQCRTRHGHRCPEGQACSATEDQRDDEQGGQYPEGARSEHGADALQKRHEFVMTNGERVRVRRDALISVLQARAVRAHQGQRHAKRHKKG